MTRGSGLTPGNSDDGGQLQECGVGLANGSMALSLSWAGGGADSAPPPLSPAFVTSHADGYLRSWRLPEAGSEEVVAMGDWQAHELETWSVACNPHTPDWSLPNGGAPTVFSGADDSALCGWAVGGGGQLRQPGPVLRVRRAHDAGVTVLSLHPSRPHLLLSGSYDETIRLWCAPTDLPLAATTARPLNTR